MPFYRDLLGNPQPIEEIRQRVLPVRPRRTFDQAIAVSFPRGQQERFMLIIVLFPRTRTLVEKTE